MPATKIKVLLKTIQVHDDSDLAGSGEWMFKATVRRVATSESLKMGDPAVEHETNSGVTLALNWELELDILPTDTRIEIKVEATDKDPAIDDKVGWVRAVLNVPILHDYDLALRSSTGHYTASIAVQITAQSDPAAGAVTTIVQHSESSTYNTIHDGMLSRMVHICPVIPVPWATGIPPIAKGVQTLTASPQEDLSINSTKTDLNALPNPSLIPVIKPTDPDFAKRCARIRITQFRPADLDLGKLIWKALGTNIKLWDGAKSVTEITGGREVLAYGVLDGADEEGTIEVRWNGDGKPLLATYRAWVGKPKVVPTRANIIKTTAPLALNPTITAAQIKAQIHYNNVILWQSGIFMELDADATLYNAAVRLDTGIFEITRATNDTFNVVKDAAIIAPLLNSRKGVFNVAYLHTCAGSPSLNGSATDRRISPAEGSVTLAGTPSTSWVQPTGVFPDDDAGTITMKRMGPTSARDVAQKPLCGDGEIGSICGCIMTQQGAANAESLTLAHELGHVLGLHHRGSGGNQVTASFDGVNHLAGPNKGKGHPWDENLMTYGPNSRRQDLDLIQTQVVRKHPLVKDLAAPAPPPPPPPPPDAKPVPAEWLPTKEDITLLQEYLGGTRPGLTHTGYDLGTSGPKGDGVDGINGSKTKAAIRQFQTDHGNLDKDGIYGPATRAAFDEELNPK